MRIYKYIENIFIEHIQIEILTTNVSLTIVTFLEIYIDNAIELIYF